MRVSARSELWVNDLHEYLLKKTPRYKTEFLHEKSVKLFHRQKGIVHPYIYFLSFLAENHLRGYSIQFMSRFYQLTAFGLNRKRI